MSQRVDLGPCSGLRHDGDPARCAVLLPGMVYPTRAPVLWFARETALTHGWSALEVLGEPGEHEDPIEWQRAAAEAALAAAGSARVLVIGKSLATLLAGHVSDLDLPAVWLTPALTEPAVSEGLARARRATIVMGGTADDFWRREAIPSNPALEVVELPGLDHALQLPGDPLASLDALRQVVEAVERMVAPSQPEAASPHGSS
ncbi:MAG TPA: hypothetical protein VFB39_01310 [Solirubrobacteraceae bacterium]|nr:hypothetical protein [Solirubrobacteraceae bacterium]